MARERGQKGWGKKKRAKKSVMDDNRTYENAVCVWCMLVMV
nr:hypothetical protein [Campylobacter sp.]